MRRRAVVSRAVRRSRARTERSEAEAHGLAEGRGRALGARERGEVRRDVDVEADARVPPDVARDVVAFGGADVALEAAPAEARRHDRPGTADDRVGAGAFLRRYQRHAGSAQAGEE